MAQIPKIIHYCWFGGGIEDALIESCKASWQKHLPDYQIMRWDESNVDMSNPFISDMYKKKCWAFIADFVRLKVLYEHGGIYLDTDIEVIKSFDPLLNYSFFCGEEAPSRPASGVMGCVLGHPFPAECMEMMQRRHQSGQAYLIGPELLKVAMRSKKFDVEVLPPEYFYPYNPYDRSRKINVLMYWQITANTYAIHHWNKSWEFSTWEKIRRKLRL